MRQCSSPSGDPVFPRLDEFLALRALLVRERAEAAGMLARLLALPAAQRERAARAPGSHHTLAVVELLVERSGEEGPLVGLELANLAVAVADGIQPARYGGRALVYDERARAWAQLAEARRRGGDLGGAAEALDIADILAQEGSGDPLVEGHLLELRAALLTDWGDVEAAHDLHLRAAEIYESVADGNRSAGAREAASRLGFAASPVQVMG